MTLEQLISDWKAGKEVRLLHLGHGHVVRQKLTYKYALELAETFLNSPDHSMKEFSKLSRDIRPPRLLTAEHEAAESLAFVAVTRGLEQAFAEYSDHQFFIIQREDAA